MVGIEPTLCYHKQILSLSRLPVPPHEHIKAKYRQLSYTQAVFRLALSKYLGISLMPSSASFSPSYQTCCISTISGCYSQPALLILPISPCFMSLSPVSRVRTYGLSSTQRLLYQLSYDSYSLSWFTMDFLFVYSLYVWTMLISQLSSKCWRRESNSYDVSTEGF